jgi:hypothetical protein
MKLYNENKTYGGCKFIVLVGIPYIDANFCYKIVILDY